MYGGLPENRYSDSGTDSSSKEDSSLDDVWILSLPSFRWIYAGSGGGFPDGREGAACALVNNKYMLAYRGRTGSAINKCDEGSGLWFYDLEDLAWRTNYTAPDANHVWKVPEKIYNIIGGE